jgi:hypothetical protein
VKFIRAHHVQTSDGKNVTFGIDTKGEVWIATDTGNPDVKPQYFGMSALTFGELTHSLTKLSFAALHYKATGDVNPVINNKEKAHHHGD